MFENHIPLALPDLGGNEEAYVVAALRSGWISAGGEFVRRFEREFAAAVAARHVLAVCNGTSALHLALLALDVGPGDEVLLPSLSFVATANAVRYTGAEPVFVDIDPRTWCIDPTALASRITPRSKAIIAVHLYGHPADMDAINAVARGHGLQVVEDAAEAFGATYKGRPVGGLGTIGTFSFYGNKIITSGEGGAVTTNDPVLHARMELLRGQGMDPGRRYFFPVVGHNYRPTNIGCALLCAQLERVGPMLDARRAVARRYASLLRQTPGLAMQPVDPTVTVAPWLVSVTINEAAFGRSRDQVIDDLAAAGIETRPFFIPLHTLPPYREQAARQNARLPATDRLAARGLNLPTYTTLSDAMIERVCATLLNAGNAPSRSA